MITEKYGKVVKGLGGLYVTRTEDSGKIEYVSCYAKGVLKRDEEKILSSGGAYFIHDNGALMGIGWMEDTKLLAVASVVPGAGQQLMHTLMSLVEGADMTIEVASTNHKAIRLYEKLGFLQLCEVKKWYIVP